MNLDETRTILNIMWVAYPNTFKNWDEKQRGYYRNLVMGCFRNLPYKLVERAVYNIIINDTNPFAPSIGQIMSEVKSLISVYDAETAWSEIEWITRNVSENVHNNIKELDDIARTIIRSDDIRRYKENSGSMEKAKYSFIQRYNKKKEELEAKAIESGNLQLIAKPERLQELAVAPEKIGIEHKEEDWCSQDI